MVFMYTRRASAKSRLFCGMISEGNFSSFTAHLPTSWKKLDKENNTNHIELYTCISDIVAQLFILLDGVISLFVVILMGLSGA